MILNEWDVRARYLLQFYLDRSRNWEVSWYHLNQRSNPTVRTIKVTGLENLYRKDDKYVSKGNVLFNLWYILISVDCRSTRLSEKSACHLTMIGIVRLLSIDFWMSMKETLWVYGRMGQSDNVQWIQSPHLHNPLVYKKSISHATLANPTRTTHSLVSAPLIPSDTCRRVYFCFSYSLILVFCRTEWSTFEMNLAFIWRNFRRRWGHWIYM